MPPTMNSPGPRGDAVQPAPPRANAFIRRILVGLDLKHGDEGLLDSLFALPAWGVEELILAHVVRLSPAPVIHHTDPTRGVGEKLAQAHVRLAPRFRVELSMLSGDPGLRLAGEAKARGADAIVLGSRHRSRFEETLIGSTVAEVLRRTDLPVLVVPQARQGDRHTPALPAPKESRILCPTDFSEPASRALQLVGALAQAQGCPVTLLHVVEGGEPRHESEGRRQLSRLATSLEESGVSHVETSLTRGVPWQSILEHAGDGNGTLIVMGARGRRVLPGLILGSQSRWVVGHSAVPVLLVPNGQGDP
jgi:nucleotide-binding universal stress UspA family protein